MIFEKRIERNQRGFTFVELMVTVAIIAILAATSVPAIIQWLPNYRLKKAARDMFSHFQQARLQAVRLDTEVAVFFDNANNAYQVISGGADGLYNLGGDDVVLNTTPLEGYGSGVGFGSGEAKLSGDGGTAFPPAKNWDYVLGDYVLFNPKGVVYETGYVYLTNDRNASFAVGTPSLSGIIELMKWYNNGGWG